MFPHTHVAAFSLSTIQLIIKTRTTFVFNWVTTPSYCVQCKRRGSATRPNVDLVSINLYIYYYTRLRLSSRKLLVGQAGYATDITISPLLPTGLLRSLPLLIGHYLFSVVIFAKLCCNRVTHLFLPLLALHIP